MSSAVITFRYMRRCQPKCPNLWKSRTRAPGRHTDFPSIAIPSEQRIFKKLVFEFMIQGYRIPRLSRRASVFRMFPHLFSEQTDSRCRHYETGQLLFRGYTMDQVLGNDFEYMLYLLVWGVSPSPQQSKRLGRDLAKAMLNVPDAVFNSIRALP